MPPWIIPLIAVGAALVLVAVIVVVGVTVVGKRSAENQVSEPIHSYYNSLSLVWSAPQPNHTHSPTQLYTSAHLIQYKTSKTNPAPKPQNPEMWEQSKEELTDILECAAWCVFLCTIQKRWFLHDCCMIAAWLLHDCCIIAAWLLHDCSTIAAWLRHNFCIIAAWLRHNCCMITMWCLYLTDIRSTRPQKKRRSWWTFCDSMSVSVGTDYLH